MKNGIYVVRLDLHDEFEIAELFNGKWFPFRSLSTKYSEKDVIFCEISFEDPTKSAQFSVSYPEDAHNKYHVAVPVK